MQLEDNKYIPKKVVEILEDDDWTINKLATAGVGQLTKYDGISKVTAQRIINEARQLMNDAIIVETEEMERTTRERRTPLEVIGIIEVEGWTLEQIATAGVEKLLDYCTEDTAKKAIQIAIQRVNEKKFAEGYADAPTVVAVPDDDGPKASVRVRRIKENNK